MSHPHQITGVGPVAADGSCLVYTVKAKAYTVSASELATYGSAINIGDHIVENDDGTHTIVQNHGTLVPEPPSEDIINDGNTNVNETNNI